jgi:hypothetical protein
MSRGVSRRLCFVMSLVGGLGCAPAEHDPTGAPPTPVPTASTPPVSSTPPVPVAPTVPDHCVPPPGYSGSPRSIAEVVALVNAMPKPVTLACFVEALTRPLAVNATRSTLSLQPSMGDRSPRMFLFVDPLILSVVPEGDGSVLLEFGELRSESRSLKGEVHFPVESTLSPASPFERIMYAENLSNCSFCHADATQAEDITFTEAFVSTALRPQAYSRVSLSHVLAEHERCDVGREPERCALLKAIFAQGQVVERDFPLTMPVFF